MSHTPNQKVLVLSENFPPKSGGSGRWFWELYSRLPAEDFIIVTDTVTDNSIDSQIPHRIIRLPFKSAEWGVKSVVGLKFYWRSMWAIRKIVVQHGITHIHCGRVIHEGFIAWLVSLITKVKFICYIHGEDIETAAMSREHDMMVRKVCAKSTLLICNSVNSQNIARRLHYDFSNTKVLHPGADCEKFVPMPVDDAFKQEMDWKDKLVILTVGRLQKRKGHDKMIEALPSILEKHPNAIYCIVGDGECKQSLETLVGEYKLENSVRFLNELTDVQMIKCYQQCDVFILPNRTIDNDIEGVGMVLVEAQACAKPVIAGDSGGTVETMIVNETGLIIDCNKPDVIAQTINTLFDNPNDAKLMGEKGAAFVNKTFDWKPHVVKAKALFSEHHK